MNTIRELFSTQRQIDRRIEKVIDYYAADEDRLASEIAEYEATNNVEACFRKFLEVYQAGVQGGQVTEVGIWVAGFYGSGKSSFTKYLGFALDSGRTVHGEPFLDLLSERLRTSDVQASLRTVAKRHPAAVVLLDLGAEQLAESSAISVTNVLYWKVLQVAGYSKEKKLAQLEFTLDQHGLYDPFRAAYGDQYGTPWEDIHNDPLLGVSRASRLMPQFMPQDFPEPDTFSKLRFELSESVRDLAGRMIDLMRRHTGYTNVLFLIDEAGQYVAPRGELILNLDGLARSFKELGQGRVWIVATGQQTLSEIVERAAYNTPELNKLRDRFPISIELDARDIKEITYRRLLTKSDAGTVRLRQLFQASGQSLITHTRLTGTPLYRDDPSMADFERLYPFLPQHFEVLMQLVRVLARSTGGVGLRSAIRVIQDVLVDTSRILPADAIKLADRPVGALATVDDFYKTLRADINKGLPHVVAGVDLVEERFPAAPLTVRVAQAVAAMQLLEDLPRTTENIAALLYPQLGAPPLLDGVRQALAELVAQRDLSFVEDPQTGGYQFLSASVGPLQRKRQEYAPTSGELNRVRDAILRSLLEPQPAVRLENTKDVRAAVRANRRWLIGDQEDIAFELEMVHPSQWERRRTELLKETAQQTEYRSVIVWLFPTDTVAEDLLPEVRKSEKIVGDIDERTADRDVAQYRRAEEKLAERNRERVQARLREALAGGVFIFRGRPTPVRSVGATLEMAARSQLAAAAAEVFHQYHLVNIRPGTDLAAKFLEVERLDHMPRERDPLGLVVRQGGSLRVDVNKPALAETLRAFRELADASGGGRLTGKALQDYFAAPPYGWSKDAVRYLLAALLVAGEIELYSGGETLKTAGPAAIEAVKSTLAFNRVGVGLRDAKIGMDVLDRAALRLEELFGDSVLPLEDPISRAARKHLPDVVESAGSLPARLRLLGLAGEERARDLLGQLTEMLKGDAGDAPSRLGVPNSTLPDDIRWAQDATKALNNGGEDDVRQTTRLLADVKELESLFPDQVARLALAREIEQLTNIVRSELFHEQLPTLRGATRAIRQRITQAFSEECDAYCKAVEQAQDQLEAHPGWLRLTPEDQAQLASRLEPVTMPTQDPQRVLADYRTLLVRVNGVPAVLAEATREIGLRQLPLELPIREPEDVKLQLEAVVRLEQTTEELEETRKLEYLGYMATAMAHALNQPIGVIRAIASASLSDYSAGLLAWDEVQERFERVKGQTDRLAHIVGNMRAFAKGDTRRREVVNLSQLVAQTCEMFAEQFKSRHIQLDCSTTACAPDLQVWANPVQLQEVLIVLLTNARDALKDRPDAWVGVVCEHTPQGTCVFSVEDNGPGLPAEYRNRLFMPFATTKPSEQGTGLGLFASKRMIVELGGELRYEDRAAGGARFVVQLPLSDEALTQEFSDERA